MATDEEILLKVSKLLENFNISEQKTEKVLREVTEDEMRVLEDVLDDLNPANLPLNDLFSNKMRVVIPFPTVDTNSELGKFSEFSVGNFQLRALKIFQLRESGNFQALPPGTLRTPDRLLQHPHL